MSESTQIIPGDSCWSTVGVGGTQSCPRLAEVGHCRLCPVYMDAGRRLLDQQIPADYRTEWTTQASRLAPPETPATLSFVQFAVAGHWLGLKSTCCLQMVDGRPVHRVPFRSNAVFLGLVNVGGAMLLCASLQQALGLADKAGVPPPPGGRGLSRWMLVTAWQGARWCFPVDQTEGISVCPAAAVRPAEPGSMAAGTVDSGTRSVALLDEARLFTLLEQSITQ